MPALGEAEADADEAVGLCAVGLTALVTVECTTCGEGVWVTKVVEVASEAPLDELERPGPSGAWVIEVDMQTIDPTSTSFVERKLGDELLKGRPLWPEPSVLEKGVHVTLS